MLWLNGTLLPAKDARIDPGDRGFTLGDGLFETIRVAAGQPLHLDRHLARLRAGMQVLDLPLPFSDQALVDAMELLIATGSNIGSLRLTLSRGCGPRGLAPPAAPMPTTLMTIAPTAQGTPTPVRLVTARATRRNEHSPLSRLKTLNCLDAILARQEATQRGADDTVMLNTSGRVAETTVANLFAVIDGDLVTPPVSDGVLPGVRRSLILEGQSGQQRSLSPNDLARAGEVFLSNSLGLIPVIEIDGKAIGEGVPGPVCSELRNADP